jgi:hypothetical protein
MVRFLRIGQRPDRSIWWIRWVLTKALTPMRDFASLILSSWVQRNFGRCQFYSSAGSSKIKIRTSSRLNWLYALTKSEELATSGHGQIRSWSFQTRAAAPRARDAWFFSRKFTESRAHPPRGSDASSVPVNSTVLCKYCTFVCGSLFGRIKLNYLYQPEQTSTYKGAILAEY